MKQQIGKWGSGTHSRRTVLAGLGATAASALVTPRVFAQATTAVTIPEVTVRQAGHAYTNHAWTVLASQKGFLKDAGITMEGGAPKILVEQQVIPQLRNREIDISTTWFGMVLQGIDKMPDMRPIHAYSYFQGNTILTAPNSGFKTIDDFISEGMVWEDAAAAAMSQLKGQQFAITSYPSTYSWNENAFGYAGLSMQDAETIPLDDPKIVQLALSGRVPFAAPGGAVQIYQLQFEAGWRPVLSTSQIVKYMPGGENSAVNSLLNYETCMCTQQFLDENRDTVLRWSGAIHRTLDYIFGPDQEKALTEYAPFINSHTGAQMDAKSIKFIFDVVDPFFPWKDQARIWNDPTDPLYYKTIYNYQLKKLVEAGTIPAGDYDVDAIMTARTIWQELDALRIETEGLLAKLTGTVASDRQAHADEAKRHFANFNFLDAARYARAATA